MSASQDAANYKKWHDALDVLRYKMQDVQVFYDDLNNKVKAAQRAYDKVTRTKNPSASKIRSAEQDLAKAKKKFDKFYNNKAISVWAKSDGIKGTYSYKQLAQMTSEYYQKASGLEKQYGWSNGNIKVGAPKGPSTPIGRPNVPISASGSVSELQQALKNKGFDPGAIDGQMGPRTRSAIMAFQRANGLTADGIVGPKTGGALGVSFRAGAGGGTGGSGTSSSGGLSGSGGSGGGSIPSGQPATQLGTDADVRSRYGYLAWLLDIPEVGGVLRKAASDPNISAGQIEADIENTTWWRTHSSTVRDWIKLTKEDPRSATQKLNAQTDALRAQASQLGITISGSRLKSMASTALQTGWTDQEMRQAIANEFHYKAGAGTGLAGTSEVELNSLAGSYLVPLANSTKASWIKKILAGNAQPDDFKNYLIQQAKSLFPSLSDALDKGITVDQYIDPYRQVAAKTLELNPDAIDFTNPKWNKAITQIDPKTHQRTVMSLSDWQNYLQSNPTYGYQHTQQARDQAYEMVDNLSKTYGLTA